jgi:hypothetical protein
MQNAIATELRTALEGFERETDAGRQKLHSYEIVSLCNLMQVGQRCVTMIIAAVVHASAAVCCYCCRCCHVYTALCGVPAGVDGGITWQLFEMTGKRVSTAVAR